MQLGESHPWCTVLDGLPVDDYGDESDYGGKGNDPCKYQVEHGLLSGTCGRLWLGLYQR
jgi:hypothetical protein